MKKYIKPSTLVVALRTNPMMISASDGKSTILGSSNEEYGGVSDSRESGWFDDEE